MPEEQLPSMTSFLDALKEEETYAEENAPEPYVAPSEETTEEETPEIVEEAPPEKAPKEVPPANISFDNITFEEPAKPTFESSKYLKAWGVDSIDALRESSPELAELLETADKLAQDKYKIELDTYNLKIAPEVKEAVVTQQVNNFIKENTDNWTNEFVNDVISKEDLKIMTSLNKTKTQELQTYLAETLPQYVFNQKVNGKQVYNPFIFYKTEIINKIRDLGKVIPKAGTQPNIPQKPVPTLDQRKASANISNSGSAPKIPSMAQGSSKLVDTFKEMGI